MDKNLIASNLADVRRRIHDAASKAHRDPDDIQLLAVSKKKPPSLIQAAVESGQFRFGENYLQEALEKIQQCGKLATLEWHFLGRIQSNKCKHIAQHFHWVHSVDRLEIAQRLSQHCADKPAPLNVLLQINPDAQQGKGGIEPQAALPLAKQMADLPGIKLRGLMCIPEPKPNLQQMQFGFSRVRDLFDELNAAGVPLDTLSMGMSRDLEMAIAAGSTLVRIGTAIFGAR